MPIQTVSNACYDGHHGDCGLLDPAGYGCSCGCHAENETDRQLMVNAKRRQWPHAPTATQEPSSHAQQTDHIYEVTVSVPSLRRNYPVHVFVTGASEEDASYKARMRYAKTDLLPPNSAVVASIMQVGEV